MQVPWAPARAAARAPWRVRGRGCCMSRGTRLASSSSSFRPASETGRRHRRSERRAAGGASGRRRQRGAAASQRPEAAGGGGGGGREDTKTVSECGPRLQGRGRPAPASVGPAGVDTRGRGLAGGAPGHLCVAAPAVNQSQPLTAAPPTRRSPIRVVHTQRAPRPSRPIG